MENDRNKINPQKRKPIHENVAYNEIQDNIKNNVIMAQSKLQKPNSLLEVDSDPTNSDDEDVDIDRCERSSEEFVNTTYNVEDRPRRRLREPTPNDTRKKLSTLKEVQKLKPKIKENVRSFNTQQKQINNCKRNWLSILIFVITILIIVVCVSSYLNMIHNIFPIYFQEKNSKTNSEESVLKNVKDTLLSLKSRYKNQDTNLWQSAYIGILELIKRPHRPSIILLLGEKSDPIDCLATLLGNVSSNALSSGRLTLTPSEFSNDMGAVIEDLRVKIRNNKAVIIWDLLNINVEALKAFHNLCDRINPLVEEVIYIITIIADNFDKEINPLEFVEKELVKKLSGKMKDDAIQPLITRITDGPILTVKPEPTVADCPLPKASKK